MKRKVFYLFDELIKNQKEHLLKEARRIVPHVVEDDLLQPNDFPELERNPLFRYEEGVLHGFQAAKAALLAETTDNTSPKSPVSEKRKDPKTPPYIGSSFAAGKSSIDGVSS